MFSYGHCWYREEKYFSVNTKVAYIHSVLNKKLATSALLDTKGPIIKK